MGSSKRRKPFFGPGFSSLTLMLIVWHSLPSMRILLNLEQWFSFPLKAQKGTKENGLLLESRGSRKAVAKDGESV